MLPEDFHLQVTADGFYRNWPGISDYSDQFQVWNLSTSNLIDVAQEPGTTNLNFGATEGSTHPKIKFVRHPNNPEYYCYKPDGTYVGFGTNNGITHRDPRGEPGLLRRIRAGLPCARRPLGDRPHPRRRPAARCGQARPRRLLRRGVRQRQELVVLRLPRAGLAAVQAHARLQRHELPRHRPSTPKLPRDDAMYFGEHLGGTPQQPYIDAGMRLLDNALSSTLNGVLATGPLTGLDRRRRRRHLRRRRAWRSATRRAPTTATPTSASSSTPSCSRARACPSSTRTATIRRARSARSANRSPPTRTRTTSASSATAACRTCSTSTTSSRAAARSPSGATTNVLAYERQDKRENASMSDADGTTLLFMMNCDSSNGEGGRAITTTFPAGSYLYQYATGPADNGDSMANFYYTVPVEPAGQRSRHPEGRVFRPLLAHARDAQRQHRRARDHDPAKRRGPSDADLRPQGRPGRRPGVQSLRPARREHDRLRLFLHRAAHHRRHEPVVPRPRRRLGGKHPDGTRRRHRHQLADGPRAAERATCATIRRGCPRTFSSATSRCSSCSARARNLRREDTSRNIIGSVGAETYQATIGTAGFTVNNGSGTNTSTSTATYAYHDPGVTALDGQSGATLQFYPAPENAAGSAGDRVAEDRLPGTGQRRPSSITRRTARPIPKASGGVAGNAATQVVQLALPAARQQRRQQRHRLVEGHAARLARRHGAALQDRRVQSATPPSVFPSSAAQRRAQEADGNAFPDHQLQRDDRRLSIRTTITAPTRHRV